LRIDVDRRVAKAEVAVVGKKMVTWIVLADGARARVVANKGPGIDLQPIYEEEDAKAMLPAREIEADRPGRTFDSGGRGNAAAQGRHAYESPTDPRRKLQADFIRGVAELLEDAALKGSFDRLVLIAPPKALGDLRSSLTKNVSRMVSEEIPKDLVGVPIHELPERLQDVLKS
jgi:protein required for attachment to host cells